MGLFPQSLARDLALQALAHAYSNGCVLVFALCLMRLRATAPHAAGAAARGRPWVWRASCLAAVAALVLGQPYIYATPTQPAVIGLASLCMMTAWSLLGLLLLPRAQLPASVGAVMCAGFMHTMHGVREVHVRRQRQRMARVVQHAAGEAAGAAAGPPHGADALAAGAAPAADTAAAGCVGGTAGKAKARARRVVHVSAFAATEPDALEQATFAPSATAGAAAQRSGPAEPPQVPLLPMVWTLLRLVITYDVGFALLCCSGLAGGCTCSGRPLPELLAAPAPAPAAGPRALLAPLARLLRPGVASYYAWALAAGALLPLQMGILYAATRLALATAGRVLTRQHVARRRVFSGGAAAYSDDRGAGAQLLALAAQLPPEAFESPLAAASIGELWAARWHQFLRYHFQTGLGHRLLAAGAAAPWIGPAVGSRLPPRARAAARRVASTAVAFGMSGLLHEYLTWAAWGDVSGRYMLFFGAHGAAVVAEGLAAELLPRFAASRAPRGPGAAAAACWRAPAWLRHAYVICFVTLASPLFVETYRAHGYFSRSAWHPLLAPVAARALASNGWCTASACGA